MQANTTTQINSLIEGINFLTRLNVALTSDHEFKSNIDRALKLVGNHLDIERIHIIKVEENRNYSALYEWNSESVAPIKHHLQNIDYIFDRKQEELLYKNGYLIFDEKDESLLPRLKAKMKQHATKNMILFPLYVHGNLFSFLAYSQCNYKGGWASEDIHLMSRIADVIAANIDKNIVISKLFYHVSQYAKNAQAGQ